MKDAFGVEKGLKMPKALGRMLRSKKPSETQRVVSDYRVDDPFDYKPGTTYDMRVHRMNVNRITEGKKPLPGFKTSTEDPFAPIPHKQGSNSPAAQRAKALWQAKQDARTPQARNAWKAGRHIND